MITVDPDDVVRRLLVLVKPPPGKAEAVAVAIRACLVDVSEPAAAVVPFTTRDEVVDLLRADNSHASHASLVIYADAYLEWWVAGRHVAALGPVAPHVANRTAAEKRMAAVKLHHTDRLWQWGDEYAAWLDEGGAEATPKRRARKK